MRIKPNGFAMNLQDYRIYQDQIGDVASSGYPVSYMDLFTTISGVAIPT
jgi:hypothetical protein